MTTVSAAPRNPKCTITADIDSSGKFATKLGEFEIESYPGHRGQPANKYGSLQVDAYDAAWAQYAVKNTSTQVEVQKKGRGKYEVEVWAMTPGRKAEARVQVSVDRLPLVVQWNTLGPQPAPGQPGTAQEGFGRTRVKCK